MIMKIFMNNYDDMLAVCSECIDTVNDGVNDENEFWTEFRDAPEGGTCDCCGAKVLDDLEAVSLY